MVADVVGSSRLIEADEAAALSAMRERWSEIVEPLVKEHSGRIVKFMGDELLAEFASAVNAVNCGLAVQERMAKANEGIDEDRRIVFRIGINVGDVVGEGSDIFGDGVNVAARIEAMAEPGSLCITGGVQDTVRGKIEAATEDLGERTLKNLERPVRLWPSHRRYDQSSDSEVC
jgi:class 3 adenylate cyclase